VSAAEQEALAEKARQEKFAADELAAKAEAEATQERIKLFEETARKEKELEEKLKIDISASSGGPESGFVSQSQDTFYDMTKKDVPPDPPPDPPFNPPPPVVTGPSAAELKQLADEAEARRREQDAIREKKAEADRQAKIAQDAIDAANALAEKVASAEAAQAAQDAQDALESGTWNMTPTGKAQGTTTVTAQQQVINEKNAETLNPWSWMQTGGVVPGLLGSMQPIMAHAGETILPTHLGSSWMDSTKGGFALQQTGGGQSGGDARSNTNIMNKPTTINIYTSEDAASTIANIERMQMMDEASLFTAM